MGNPERAVGVVIIAAIIACTIMMLRPSPGPAAAASGPLPLSASQPAPAANESADLLDPAPPDKGWSVDPAVVIGERSFAPAIVSVLNRTSESSRDAATDLTRAFTLLSSNVRVSTGFAADRNADGILDEADLADFHDDWAFGDPNADFNADGTIDSLDLVAFVDAFDTQEHASQPEQRLHLGRDVSIRVNSAVHLTDVRYSIFSSSSAE